MINIKEEYLKGKTLKEIALKVGCSRQTIANRLKNLGVNIRSQKEAQTIRTGKENNYNHSCFKELDSQVEYWLGFLMADGNVFKQRISLNIIKSDIEHTINFAKFVGVTRKPSVVNNTCRFNFSSKQMVEDLERWGIIPCKSLICKANLELVNSRHFWRGVIDGDGHIGFSGKYPRLTLGCGSKDLLIQFQEYAQGILRKPIKIHRRGQDNYYSVSLKGKPATKVIKTLYHCNNMSLFRKQQVADNIISAGGSYC